MINNKKQLLINLILFVWTLVLTTIMVVGAKPLKTIRYSNQYIKVNVQRVGYDNRAYTFEKLYIDEMSFNKDELVPFEYLDLYLTLDLEGSTNNVNLRISHVLVYYVRQDGGGYYFVKANDIPNEYTKYIAKQLKTR